MPSERAKSDGRGRRAAMPLSRPSLTIFAWSPSTCARGVPAFRGACDKRRTREVCHNGVEAGVARDRDLRAGGRVGDYYPSGTNVVGGERGVNHVANTGFNPGEGPGAGEERRADSNDIRAGLVAPVQFGRDVGRHREGGRRGGEREGDEDELHVVFLGLRLRRRRLGERGNAQKRRPTRRPNFAL